MILWRVVGKQRTGPSSMKVHRSRVIDYTTMTDAYQSFRVLIFCAPMTMIRKYLGSHKDM